MWRIESLNVENFRRIKSASLAGLPNIVAVSGRNDEGKTSLLDAARYMLLGYCRDANGKQALIADLVGPHGKAARIEAVIVDGQARYDVRCIIGKPSSFSVTRDGMGEVATNSKALLALLDMDPAHAELALNPAAMLSGADLGDALAAMTGAGQWDAESVKEYAGDKWPELETYLDGKPPVSMEALGKDAYADRAAVKARIADAEAKLAHLPSAPPVSAATGATLTPADLPAMEERLGELRTTRDNLNRQIGGAATPRETLADAERMEALAREKRQQAADVGAQALPDIKAAQDALRTLGARITDGEGKIAQSEDRARTIHAEKQALQGALSRLEAAAATPTGEVFPDGTCNCGIKLTPAQLKAARADAAGALEKTREQAEAKRAELEAKEGAFQRANDGLANMRKALRELKDEAEKHKQTIADGEAAAVKQAAEVKALENEATELERRAAGIRALPNTPPVDVAGLEAQLADVMAELERGEAATHLVGRMAERADIEAQLSTWRKQREFLEWACGAFERGQYQAAVAQRRAQEFAERANRVLVGMGYVLAVGNTGKALEFLIGKPGGAMYPYRLVSKAVRTLTQIAAGVAYSYGLILVDDVEGMDGNNRLAFVSMLRDKGEEILKGRSIWFASAYALNEAPDVAAMRDALQPIGLVWVENGHTK